MTRPEPMFTRGELRVWLKMVIQSGLLDKLPKYYDRGGEINPQLTELVVHRLLAEIQIPELSRHDLMEIAAKIAEFRRWVEARRKASRQLILTEVETQRVDPMWLEKWGAAMYRARETGDRRRLPPKGAPRADPMWDEHVDG